MSDQIVLGEQKRAEEQATAEAAKSEVGSANCPVQGKAWIKGAFGMALCCAAPVLLTAAIVFFGLSLGAIASGTLSVLALVACPIGMLLMMRMMTKDKD